MSWSDKFRTVSDLEADKLKAEIASRSEAARGFERTILAGAPGLDHNGVVKLKNDLTKVLHERARLERQLVRLGEKEGTRK